MAAERTLSEPKHGPAATAKEVPCVLGTFRLTTVDSAATQRYGALLRVAGTGLSPRAEHHADFSDETVELDVLREQFHEARAGQILLVRIGSTLGDAMVQDFDYTMCGERFEERDGHTFVSFGGLLMVLSGACGPARSAVRQFGSDLFVSVRLLDDPDT